MASRIAWISGSDFGTASMMGSTSRPPAVPVMFLARRARLNTLPFSTPGRSASESVIRWTLASTSGVKTSPVRAVMPMRT